MMNLLPNSDQAPTSEKKIAKRRLDYIDAMRGAACLGVMMHHTFAAMPVPTGTWHYPAWLLITLSKPGWLGVSLFLVLSGFCLFYPLAARYDLGEIHLNLATFAKRRIRRIIPPYYAALFLLTVIEILYNRHRSGHWDMHIALHNRTDLLLHLFMLHNLTADTLASVSPAFWSLALECQLYVIFPLLVWAVVRFGLRSILISTFLIAVIWQGICYQHLGFIMVWNMKFAAYYHALPGRCFEFAAGMVAASLVARPRRGQSRIALGLILILIVPSLYFILKVSRFGPLCDQAWGIIFTSALVLLCKVPDYRFEQNRVLRSLVWLGAISYSVYLIHQPLIDIISPHLMLLPDNQAGNLLAGLIRLPILIGIGYVFHLCFERPFMPGTPRTERQAEIAAALSPAP